MAGVIRTGWAEGTQSCWHGTAQPPWSLVAALALFFPGELGTPPWEAGSPPVPATLTPPHASRPSPCSSLQLKFNIQFALLLNPANLSSLSSCSRSSAAVISAGALPTTLHSSCPWTMLPFPHIPPMACSMSWWQCETLMPEHPMAEHPPCLCCLL